MSEGGSVGESEGGREIFLINGRARKRGRAREREEGRERE